MSSSRERFEARLKELSNGEPEWNSATALWCWAVWQLRDAEIEELVEALRYAVAVIDRHDNRKAQILRTLLREYDGGKCTN